MNLRGKAILHAIRRRQADRLRLKRAGQFDRLGRGRGLAVPLGKDALALADPAGRVQSVDRKLFAATFVISTKGEDRDGDVVEPKGCLPTLTEGFGRNPVVFWDHQLDPVPIGRARHKDGSLALTVGDNNLLSTVYFHGKTQRSCEIGELVMDGQLVACSIGFAPIVAERRPDVEKEMPRGGRGLGRPPGWHFLEWELLEWSVCGVGANRDALRLSIDNGRVRDGRLRRELEPFAARLKGMVNGHSFGDGHMRFRVKDLATVTFPKAKFGIPALVMSWLKSHGYKGAAGLVGDTAQWLWQPGEKLPELGTEHRAGDVTLTLAKGKKAMEDGEEDEETLDLTEEQEDDEEESEEEEDESQGDEDEEEAVPLGAQVMRDLMAHYNACLAYCRAMLPKLEPDSAVKAFVDEHTAELQQCLGEYKALAEKTYPDVDFDGEEKDDEEDEEDKDAGAEETEEEQEEDEHEYRSGKSPRTKGLSKRCKGVIAEAAEYMRDVAEDGAMPKRFKGGHKYHAAELSKLAEDGSEVPVEEENEDEDEEKGKKPKKRAGKSGEHLDAQAILAALDGASKRQRRLSQKLFRLTGQKA